MDEDQESAQRLRGHLREAIVPAGGLAGLGALLGRDLTEAIAARARVGACRLALSSGIEEPPYTQAHARPWEVR